MPFNAPFQHKPLHHPFHPMMLTKELGVQETSPGTATALALGQPRLSLLLHQECERGTVWCSRALGVLPAPLPRSRARRWLAGRHMTGNHSMLQLPPEGLRGDGAGAGRNLQSERPQILWTSGHGADLFPGPQPWLRLQTPGGASLKYPHCRQGGELFSKTSPGCRERLHQESICPCGHHYGQLAHPIASGRGGPTCPIAPGHV